jgi:hypothetical protein
MKSKFSKFLAVFALMISFTVYAADEVNDVIKPNMLMYIQPIEYNNPISLWHPYHNYWFYQGPVVERLAKSKLDQAYGEVGLCEGNQSGRVLVWLQPRMFYNPQLQLFYGKVTANVYTGVGVLIGSYEGESKLHGYLDIKPDTWIEQSYAIAIDEMVAKMQADDAVQKLVGSVAQADGANTTPCSMVTLLPTPKIRAMSF